MSEGAAAYSLVFGKYYWHVYFQTVVNSGLILDSCFNKSKFGFGDSSVKRSQPIPSSASWETRGVE